MRVLFLDIDGVLNGDEFLDEDFPKPTYDGVEDWMLWWLDNINPASVEVLNHILEKTNTQVVLSSNRRNWASLEDIRVIFETAGFRGKIIDITPTCRFQSRGTEIRAWLDKNHPEFFLILDDDDDMEGLEPFIQIDSKTGLIPADLDRVLARIF